MTNSGGIMLRTLGIAAVAYAALASAGCALFRGGQTRTQRDRPAQVGNIDIQRVADQVNAHSRAIRSIACDRVTVTGRAKNPDGGSDPFTVDARLAFQAPGNLRMRGSFAGRPEIDLGANENEIWFWARRADANKVLVCRREDLPRVDLAIPFQPDQLAEILGVLEIDPAKWEPVGERGNQYVIQSRQMTSSGQFAIKLLLFERVPGKPDRLNQISLRDAASKQVLASASIDGWTEDQKTGITVPRKVVLDWPAEETKLTLQFGHGTVEVNTVDAEYAAQLFSRAKLTEGMEVIDLAANARRPAGGELRPAGGLQEADPALGDARRGPRKLRAR